MRVRCAPVAILLSALVADGTRAQTADSSAKGPPQAAPFAAEVESILGADTYAFRQREMRRLWGERARSHERVRELARSRDAEVAQRAQWILRRWEMGLLPNLPVAVQRRLAAADGRPAAALQTLLDGGYLPEAVEVVRLQLAGPASEETRDEITGVIASRFLSMVDQAKRNDSMDLVLEMLDLAAEPTSLAVARAMLIDRLGQTLDETNLLPRCASMWPSTRRDEVATIIFTVLGRFDEAIAAAERSGRPDLLSTPLLLDGRWAELADVAHDAIRPDLPVEASLDQYAMWLVAAHQAGMDEQVRQAAEAIAAAEEPDGQRWRALAVAGQFDAAMQLAERTDVSAAAELAATQQRFQRAFEILGVDPADPAPTIDHMLRQLSRQSGSSQTSRPRSPRQADLLEQLLTATRLLYTVGHRDFAKQTLRRIAAIPEAEGAAENTRREAALLATRLKFQELIPELVLADGQELDAESSFYLGFYFGGRAPNFFNTVRAAIAKVKPDDSPQVHFRTAMQLFAQQLPDGWDRHSDLDALHAELTDRSAQSPSRAAQIGFFGRNANIRANISRPTFLLGDFFAGLGRSDLALRSYKDAVDGGDVASKLHFADRMLAAGDAGEARSLYQSAYDALQTRGSDGRFGLSEPINDPPPSAPAALAGQAVALRRLAQVEQSDDLWETLRLVPLDPTTDSMRGYVEQLGTLGQIDRQREAAEAVLRYAAFDRSSDRNFHRQAFEHASRLSESDPAASALWMRISLVGSLPMGHLHPSGYLTVPSQWHVAEGVAAARRGDGPRATEQLTIALEYHPLNIEMAEESLPEIRKAGFDDVADAAIDRLLKAGLEHLKQFGIDANTNNNLAWVTAINGRHYDHALSLARHAVYLVPDSVSYRDTLAETLFRLGRADEAVAIERQCLQDEPDQWHVHQQIKRFSEAAGP